MSNGKVKVYGAGWCSMTTHTKEYLDGIGVAYEYIDVEQDPKASEWVKAQNGGKEKKPTVDVDGQILSEPRNEALLEALRGKGLAN